MRQKDISIDIIKCIAALLITNSHMELLYGKYSFLATGGAIGDVLFFFCSGFTLLMGRAGRLEKKYIGFIIKFIGGLCLEIYLVQYNLFTDKMNSIFPLNLLVIFCIILIAAYIVRCVGRTFSQTFQKEEYNWKDVFKPI